MNYTTYPFTIAPSSDHRATALAIAYSLVHWNKENVPADVTADPVKLAAYVGQLAKEIMNKANVHTTQA